jgi:hypothetical protein
MGHKGARTVQLVRFLRQAGFALGNPEKTRYTTASGRAGHCWHVCARIPKARLGRPSFQTSAGIARREGNRSRPRLCVGVFRRAGSTSILSETAGASVETMSFFNGLIQWPAQTGENRICGCRAQRRIADVVRTSTPRDLRVREGRRFNVVLPGVLWTGVLRSGSGGTTGATRWSRPRRRPGRRPPTGES